MNKIFKSILAAAVIAPTLTGCIEETFPTSGATQDQLAASSKATEALLWAMPAFYNTFDLMNSSQAYDWGYGAIMHVRDVMTSDFAIVSSGYDWFTAWEMNRYIGPNYMRTQWVWNFYNKQVLTCNNLMSSLDLENADAAQKTYYGAGLAFRASTYLDMARMYEFLPNDGTTSVNLNGNDVTGLTVPIVTDKTTEAESRNNPRVPRQEMFDFIMSDLNQAEELVANGVETADEYHNIPDLAVVYGLKARAYMWVEDYPKAAEYARKAIATGKYSPLTREQWLSTTDGFNNSQNGNSWMWCAKAMKEDDCVQSGILNWTAWASNEAQYGYAAAGPFNLISPALYNKMNDRDFRKLSFKAPEGSALAGQEPVLDAAFAAELPEYASYKFRPGAGNTQDFNVGSATCLPLMRIEEMYLIEAEAVAHTAPAQGKQLLEDFMKNYRYNTYSCLASDEAGVIDEIFTQKCIELWGEGQTFFDYKRLNKPVIRGYKGTNFQPTAQFNTTTRPAWMNFCIVETEGNNNEAVKEWNNPDPSNCYTSLNF